MESGQIQRLRKNPRTHVVDNPNGDTTIYLDDRLLLQTDKHGAVSAFQADSRAARYIINMMLNPARYKVYDNILIEYKDGVVLSALSPMEVLLRWKRKES